MRGTDGAVHDVFEHFSIPAGGCRRSAGRRPLALRQGGHGVEQVLAVIPAAIEPDAGPDAADQERDVDKCEVLQVVSVVRVLDGRKCRNDRKRGHGLVQRTADGKPDCSRERPRQQVDIAVPPPALPVESSPVQLVRADDGGVSPGGAETAGHEFLPGDDADRAEYHDKDARYAE